jgi:hypothetical protein
MEYASHICAFHIHKAGFILATFFTHKKGTTMYRRRSPIKHLITLVCLLLAGLAMSEPLAPTSEAAAAGCRSDPVVLLSDGTILDVTAKINTDVSNVREIHYVIHGPHGVQLVSAISTPTLGFKGKETFAYYDDAAPKQYITETLVQTTYDQVGVTAQTTFVNVSISLSGLLTLQYTPVTGFNNQILRVLLKR